MNEPMLFCRTHLDQEWHSFDLEKTNVRLRFQSIEFIQFTHIVPTGTLIVIPFNALQDFFPRP